MGKKIGAIISRKKKNSEGYLKIEFILLQHFPMFDNKKIDN